MVPILMPQIGHDITTGKIVAWHKKVGDPVAKGEVILTVESEKASFEVAAEASGVLLRILYREGEEARVLTPVGHIGMPGETPPKWRSAESPAGMRVENTVGEQLERRRQAGAAAPVQGTHASPSARRVAGDLGIELAVLRGSGPGGRIVKADVLAAVSALHPASEPPAGADKAVPFNRIRKIIAERLALSSRGIPHFYLFQEVDMEEALAFRQTLNRAANVHVTITDLILWASAQVLRFFPFLNAHVESDKLLVKAEVNLGVAVAAEQGLLVAVIPRADRRNLAELSAEARRVVEEARRGHLNLAAQGTFTVTSMGMYGVPVFLPLINLPECAILGAGAVEPRVTARDELVCVRRRLTLILACDHRAVDGAYAAGFLHKIRQLLESGISGERTGE